MILSKTRIFTIGYVAWYLYTTISISEISTMIPSSLSSGMRFLGLGIIAISELFDRKYKFSKMVFIPIFIFLYFITVTIFLRRNLSYVDILLMIFVARNIDFNHFFSRLIYYIIGFNSLIVILSLTGFITNISTYRGDGWRFNLGYGWATFSMQIFFYLVCLLITTRKSKLSWPSIVLILAVNIFLNYKTDTRNAFILVNLLVVGWIVLSKTNFKFWKMKFIKVFFMFFIPVFTFIYYFLSKSYPKYLWLDDLLSGRLYLNYNAIKNYGITLFGNSMQYFTNRQVIGNEYFFIDSSYLGLIFDFGIITFILFVISWSLFQLKLLKFEKKYYILAFTAIMVHSLIDHQFFQINFNVYLLLLGLFFNGKSQANETIKKL